nr:MAG TPA: hypothetical protein [Caudoviricetes sp.]
MFLKGFKRLSSVFLGKQKNASLSLRSSVI